MSTFAFPQIPRTLRASNGSHVQINMPGEIVTEWLAITPVIGFVSHTEDQLILGDGFTVVHRPTGLIITAGCLACCRHLAAEFAATDIDWDTGDRKPAEFQRPTATFLDGLSKEQHNQVMSIRRKQGNCTAGNSCDTYAPVEELDEEDEAA